MSNNIDVTTRFYQPGDDEGIVELLKKTFPKWNEYNDPLGLWRWKYINTPLKSLIAVAVADDKIVGCSHSLIFTAKIGSEITSLSYSDDLAVDIDFRGMGIWPKMNRIKEEVLVRIAEFRYSTTANPRVKKGNVQKNLAAFPFPVTRMMKTKDIDHLQQSRTIKNMLLVKLGYYGLNALNGISNLFRPSIKLHDEFQITQVTEFDESINSFWMKIKDDYNWILEKKHEYLNWRFVDNDRGNHVKFQAMHGDEVLGYVVVGYKHGFNEGQVEDLVALKDRLDVANALINSGCEFLDELGVNTVFYQVVEGHPYQGVSRRNGFIDSRSSPTISFDYTDYWIKKREIQFLKHTAPSQVHFNYATTI